MNPDFRYIPANSTPVTKGNLPVVVYTYTSEERGMPAAIAYKGSSSKPVWHFRFPSENHRNARINSLFADVEYAEKLKAEQRAERQAFRHGFEIGDILYCSWGYEQTNIEFWQVIAKTSKTVTFREIRQTKEANAFMSGTCMPIKDDFIGDGYTRPVRPDRNGKGMVKFAETAGGMMRYLWAWDGKPKGYSEYY